MTTEITDKHQMETPSQTVGPYVHIGCVPSFAGLGKMYDGNDLGSKMINEHTIGERIRIRGHIFDGQGEWLKDAMLEIWQADSAGLFNSPLETRGTADPHFTGWGRQPVNTDSGLYEFETIRPGRVPYQNGLLQAPFIHFWVVARGINVGLHTRMYFSDESVTNAEDPVLQLIPDLARQETLIATECDDHFQFDICLQGNKETVFLNM